MSYTIYLSRNKKVRAKWPCFELWLLNMPFLSPMHIFNLFFLENDLHDPGTFWTCERIYFPGSGPGQAPIFYISRAQFLLYSFDEPSGSRIEGMESSLFCFSLFRPAPGFSCRVYQDEKARGGNILRNLSAFPG